jgi:hypothetical protein
MTFKTAVDKFFVGLIWALAALLALYVATGGRAFS